MSDKKKSFQTTKTPNKIVSLQYMHKRTIINSPNLIRIDNADALNCYQEWPTPTVIMIDGPYGIGGFPGDPEETKILPAWYAPHIAEWSRLAAPFTTLWFWGTELGWSRINSLLEVNGWKYEQAFIWNKGIGHVAGNVNSVTIRRAPVVTEICVRYTRNVMLSDRNGVQIPMQEWLRKEWIQTGLPLNKSNEACGVKNAATRKYFTTDSLWYFPPAEAMRKIVDFANNFGNLDFRPYFNINGNPFSEIAWSLLRAKWNHIHGYTNVWDVPSLHGKERLKDPNTGKSIHYNQKPLDIMEYIIKTSSDEGDIIWDPFAGLATTACCCHDIGRSCYSAEINPNVYETAVQRLLQHCSPKIAI